MHMVSDMVHVVLQPRGIAPTFLKLDSWSPGASFIPIIRDKSYKEEKNCKKKVSYTKRLNTFFKRLVQFHVGAIPRLLSDMFSP